MLLSLFGLAGGMGMPMQTSINAQLGRRVGSPFLAAMINFIIGWIALLIITVIVEHTLILPFEDLFSAPRWVLLGGAFAVVFVTGNILLLRTKKPGSRKGKAPLWIWTGGLFGDLFVIGNIITAQTVGTGMAVVILLTGLMIGGLLVDQFGLFRSTQRQVSPKEILGVAIMIIGAILFHMF